MDNLLFVVLGKKESIWRQMDRNMGHLVAVGRLGRVNLGRDDCQSGPKEVCTYMRDRHVS